MDFQMPPLSNTHDVLFTCFSEGGKGGSAAVG